MDMFAGAVFVWSVVALSFAGGVLLLRLFR